MSSAPAPVSRSSWRVSAAVVLATMVAAGSLRLLIQGDGWWWASLVVCTLAVGASAGIRASRRLRPLAPLAGIVVGLIAVLVLWVPDTLAWGVLPTDRTVEAVTGLIRAATQQIYLDSPPGSATPGLQLMVTLGLALLAVLVDAIVAELRLSWLAGLPLLLLAIVPARAIGIGDDLAGVTTTVAAFLLLVWLDRRRDQQRPPASTAAALAGAAVVGALLAQALVPTLVNPTAASAGAFQPVFAPGTDPLVRLGDQLRRGADVPVLSYRTTANTPIYLRVVTIDDLTGDQWAPTASDGTDAAARRLQAFPAPRGLSDAVARDEVATVVSDPVQRNWLPVPYPATSVDGVVGSWALQPDGLTVQAVGGTRSVPEYTVRSLQLRPTIEELRAAPTIRPADFARDLALPGNVPPIIGETARTVTAGTGTAYDQAVALQDYLRGRQFAYDENAPQPAGGGAGSMDVIAAFLNDKHGYCVHFSAAMTVMARELGIPARIAVGYQPGERRLNDPGVFEVTSHDLHAWPELYFEGIGWTRFEPTPGRGDVPRFRLGSDPAAPAPSSAPSPTPAPSVRSDRTPGDVTAAAGGSAGGPPPGGAAIGAGAALLLVAPAGLRAIRRRRRLAVRTARAGPAWDEVQDTALDLGILDSGVATPRVLAARLEDAIAGSPDERAELRQLLAAVERERFARPGSPAEPPDPQIVDRLLRRMAGSRGRLDRLRAAFLPRSVFTRMGAIARTGAARGTPSSR